MSEYSTLGKDDFPKLDFGVSTAILNPVDIFRRWCKLRFGLLRRHVKSRRMTAILLKG